MEDSSTTPFFTISIAARILGLHPRTLMLYEKEQLIVPHRTPTNRRLYSPKDLTVIHFIKYLTQQKRVNLKGVATIFRALEIAEKNDFKLKKRLFPDYSAPKSLLT